MIWNPVKEGRLSHFVVLSAGIAAMLIVSILYLAVDATSATAALV